LIRLGESLDDSAIVDASETPLPLSFSAIYNMPPFVRAALSAARAWGAPPAQPAPSAARGGKRVPISLLIKLLA
jgi:hypothetical protein